MSRTPLRVGRPADTKSLAAVVLDAMGDGLLLTSPSGAIVEVNTMSCRLLGYTRKDLLSMTMADLDVSFRQEEWAARIEDLRTRGIVRFEVVLRARDGHAYPVEVTSRLLGFDGREYVCAFLKEAAGHGGTSKSLHEGDAVLRTIFHAAPVGVATLKDRRILDVNEAFCAMFGWPRQALIGQSTRMLYGSDEIFEDVGSRAYPDVKSAPGIECLGRRSDGELFPMFVKGAPFNGINADDGIIWTAMDISVLKRSEDELRRTNRQLRMLTDCNQALFRASSETELLRLVCSVIVEEGGYAKAWVGFLEEEGHKSLRIVSLAGWDESLVGIALTDGCELEDDFKLAWKVLHSGTGRTEQIAEDRLRLQSPRQGAPIGESQSVCGFPLLDGGKPFGVLLIYSSNAGAFDASERALLAELSGDLAFGLIGLRARTERDEAHALLAETEERFSKAFQFSPVAMIISEIDTGRLVDVNAAAEQRLERTREELIGRSAIEIGMWADPAMREQVIRAVKTEGMAREYPVQIVAKSGRVRETLYSGVPITIAGKTLLLSVVTDVTERVHAAKALQESEERYRRLVATVPDMIVLTDLNGTIRLVNEEGFVKRRVIPDLNMVGKNILDFIAPQDRDRAGRNATARLSKPLGSEEYHLVLGEASTLDCEINGDVLRDARGTPIGMVYVIRDISDRKHAEEVLRTSERRFREVAANSEEFIWEIDLDGVFTYASPIVEAMLGYTPDELVGKFHFYDLYPAERREQLKKERLGTSLVETDRQGSVDEKERKDGSRIITQSSVAPIRDEVGNVIGVRGSSIDVTIQIQAQEQIKQSLREKEIMLKEIHHRVKNNMQVISSLLSLESQRVTDPHTRELFGESMNRIRTMALVHEKLYRSGSLAAIEFDEFLSSVTTDLQRYYGVPGVNCRVEAERLSLAIDMAIPFGLIANELISNALKHAFAGRVSGDIIVRLRRLPDGPIELSVSDDGVGFPADVDFHSLTSMGMTLINALTSQIDGTMRMTRDGGTQFILTVPGH
jgi:PAS domain S-box-containing protein